MNTHRHLFGFLIGPLYWAFPSRDVRIFFSPNYSYYYSNHTSHHISPIGNQSFGVSQDGLKSDGVFQCYCLGFTKATLWHICFAFLELGPSLNEHHPQYFGSIIVVRFNVSFAHLCAFSMLYYVQCWDCCQYFWIHCVG
jgi:hypothetical protein